MHVGNRYDALLLIAVLAATILSSATAAQEKKVVYYLIPSRIDEFQTESQKAIEVAFSELGYGIKAFDAENRSDLQIMQLQQAIRQKPAAIILNAVDFVSIVPTIARANQEGIPVLAYDRQIRRAPSQPKIAIEFTSVADAYAIGEKAAEEAIKLLTEHAGSIKKVLQISGDPRDDYSLEVQRGFEAKMRSAPEISITSKPAIDWEPRDAEKIVRDELDQKAEFGLVFCHAAHLISPLLSLLKDRPDIIFIGANGAPIGLKQVREGKQHREVEQPLYAQVYGLALGFREIVMRGSTLPIGRCKVLGVEGRIEEGEVGPILKLKGTVIRPEDLQRGAATEQSYWGNFVPPQESAKNIHCES
jgi:ribose transport system substrate-binding protein